ncbi:hypothetical protein NDU88_001221 [Pleurodeles waltl]|uniref:Uncharacterized protein n=1 Tax=Pleurodeles waltl TaxID=8319 RepID=A0AAV7LX09_PLEWA|nr:hypothetical protein NDU88_001221 [Pleurodeles waltl]
MQVALNVYCSVNWSTARTRGIEWEALKVVIRGESLSKSYIIRNKLGRELTQQEDILTALQHQVDNRDASETDCLAVRVRIEALWGRLDNYVHQDFRHRLYHEGDRSGRMLAWLLRRELPIILSFRGSSREKILGQVQVNLHLREHPKNIYTSPQSIDSSQMHEYLDGLQLPRLTEAQVDVLEGEVLL